jgi:hypothetical protein
MLCLLILAWTAAEQTLGIAMPLDATVIRAGAPVVVTELDLGKLKGDLRQIGWSPDGAQLYIQTIDGTPPGEHPRHYLVPATGGTPASVDRQPEWAQTYWAFKSDRSAPGVPTLMIDVKQTVENLKFGTGSAGAADGGDRAGGGTVMSGANLDRAAQSQKLTVWRFTLLDEIVSEFVNQRPIPGLMFSWGPRGTGVIAYTDADGTLMLLDQERRKQTIGGVRDAVLPAWSTDGEHLAYAQKSGRRKYRLMCVTLAK